MPRAVEGRLVGVVDLGEHHLGGQPAGDEHQLHHVHAELGPEAVIGREHAEDERIGLREAELKKSTVDRRKPLALARDLIVEPADLVADAVIDEERLARAEDGDQRSDQRVNGTKDQKSRRPTAPSLRAKEKGMKAPEECLWPQASEHSADGASVRAWQRQMAATCRPQSAHPHESGDPEKRDRVRFGAAAGLPRRSL